MSPRLVPAFTVFFALWAVAPVPAHADFLDALKKSVGSMVAKTPSGTDMPLAARDMADGLREALRVGTERVVAQIGAPGGFANDPAIHIPLPPELQKVQSTMKRFGLSGLADEVEAKLNQGAEAAMPKARDLIWKAISDMTLDDAQRIFDGGDTAATDYFRRVAETDLRSTVRPVVDTALADAGAVAAYDRLMGQYAALPFVSDVKANLSAHATQLAVDGLFHYLAREEALIRQDPAKRTTELLARVFGQ